MVLQDKTVAIVGGGPGGLTLAKLLQQEGIRVKVYERDFDKNARVQGAPLDLHDESGLAALKKAGLMTVFKNSFMKGADRKTITNEQAEVFYSDHDEKPEENFGCGHFRPEIDRGTLRRILLDSLQPQTVIWNSHFLSMERQGAGWLLHFKDGNSAYADFVVAADGANSKIRPYVTDSKPFYSGIMMVEGTVSHASRKVPRVSSLLKGGKIMAFGNERNILIGQKENDEIGYYLSFRWSEEWGEQGLYDFADRTTVLEWFEKEYYDWSPVWHELLENTIEPFILRPIFCMPADEDWKIHENVTLLGDAAHVMPPFAGEGVNMAMLDALELSKALLTDKHTKFTQAIEVYEKSMKKRAAVAALESLENGERMHSQNALKMMLDFFSSHSNA